MDECIMSTGNGKLYIHRDIPGDHGGCEMDRRFCFRAYFMVGCR